MLKKGVCVISHLSLGRSRVQQERRRWMAGRTAILLSNLCPNPSLPLEGDSCLLGLLLQK